MATKKTLVLIEHDDGYGDDLLEYLNAALAGKDMRATEVLRETQVQLLPARERPAFHCADECGD